MKRRKSIHERLSELKDTEYQEYESTEDISEDNTEEEPEDKKYTLEELEKELFNDSDVIPDFSIINKDVRDNTLLITSINKENSKEYGLPAGQYIGEAKELIEDNPMFDDMEGRIPKSIYEKTRVVEPLILVHNAKGNYQQHDLIQDLKNNTKVEDIREDIEEMGYTPASTERVDYLSIINKKDIESKIEEVLKRYNDLSNPDDKLKYYIKLRDMMTPESRMIYCSLLDKCVTILD